ncbi:bifunctional 4-hydroxy-2-oxoglutarate aldolase/2-dehydro-3-deoxy-phosphogluconate aldolase [Streptomyces sp. 6N223]|uniref:bifunctional 4-hydroxy-2-oxoglutarate aldolase/2-dehydro-3-deoxy-phosphogluconate aldolase n=1 Tax=Streptomyces sp. 6N223 TaxID=3457412 RepID=UPI003FCF7A22
MAMDAAPRSSSASSSSSSSALPRLVVIYRGLAPDAALAATEALLEAGVTGFETTLDTPGALGCVAELARRFGDRALIGAGTVRSREEVKAAADAGAAFLLSPHLDPEVVAATKEAGLVSVPGAFTPTEVAQARRAGADVVKIFPVGPVGAGYVRQLATTLPDIPLLAVGGITAELGRDCLAAGCVGVGVGVRHIDADALEAGDWPGLARGARRYLAALGG